MIVDSCTHNSDTVIVEGRARLSVGSVSINSLPEQHDKSPDSHRADTFQPALHQCLGEIGTKCRLPMLRLRYSIA